MIHWQYTPYIIPLLIAAAMCLALAFVAWRRRHAPGAAPFIWLMLAVAEWSLVYALQLSSANLEAKLLWAKFRYIGILSVPTAWLVFILQYTHRTERLTRRNLILLTIVPLIALLLVWTNELHRLIWTNVRLEESGSLLVWDASHGLGFWSHAAYSYLLILSGTFLLLQALARSPHLYRGQAGAMLVGALAPLIGNLLSTFDLVSFPLDLTPFGFTVAGLAAIWGSMRFRLLDIVPVARDAIIESIGDGVIVLDAQSRIVDLNPPAQRILGLSASDALGLPVTEVLADYTDLVERQHDTPPTHTEIALWIEPGDDTLSKGKVQRFYDLRISPLNDRHGRFIGRVIVLHDITARKQVEVSLDAQKQLFDNLVAVARVTAEQPTLEATLQHTLDMAASLTAAEYGSLFLFDEAGGVTHSIVALGEVKPDDLQDRVRRVMDKGLAGWVARHRETALVPDTSKDERWLPTPPESPYIARSALAVPIISGSILLGVLTLTHSVPGHFSAGDVKLWQVAVDQVALTLRNAQSFDAQRRMADRQMTLSEVLTAEGRHLDPQASARAAVETIAQLTGWPGVAVLMPDDSMAHLVVQAAAGTLSDAEGQHVPIDQGIVGRAFGMAQAQHVPDTSAAQGHMGEFPTARCELAIPLRIGERALGVLDLQSDQRNAFSADDVLLAESLAEAIALALENAGLYREARQSAAELSALYTITRMASRSLVLENVLSRALSSVLLLLGFDAGLVALTDPDDGQLRLVAEQGLPSMLSQRLRQSGMQDMLSAHVHHQRETLVINGFEQETPEALSHQVKEMAALGLRACFCIPLLHQDESLGAVELFVHRPRRFSSSEKALLDTISRQIATAVANARLFQAVADQSGRLEALIESSRDGIVLVGLDQQVLLINAPAHELLQLPDEPESWVGQSIQKALLSLRHRAPDVVRTGLAEMRRVQEGDEPPGEGEYEVPPHHIHWLNLPVLAGSIPVGRLLVFRDITKERELDQLRDDLVHTMVHDLRNPLTAIFMSLQLLDEPQADNLVPSQRMMLEMALTSSQKMLRLINNILDVSRLEGGRMPLERAPILLPDLVTKTLHGQSLLAQQKGLTLDSDVPLTLPPVWADASSIERVLENLIGNAIKFTPSGGLVKIMAETVDGQDAQDAEVSEVRVSVSDTGRGIPPELQSRLFQKFATGGQHESGSGLGLAYCKLVLEAHGGDIWAESEPGQGTTFTFTLPIAQESQTAKVVAQMKFS